MSGWDVPGESWEERMAARASLRRVVAEAEHLTYQAEEDRREQARYAAAVAAYNAGMTLGEAVAWLRPPHFGCACTGGPWCCIGRTHHARALVRAAHIAVKLMADVVRMAP